MSATTSNLLELVLESSRETSAIHLLNRFMAGAGRLEPALKLRPLAPGENSSGPVVELATRTAHFGRLAIEGRPEAVSGEALAALRSAIGLVAVMLERLPPGPLAAAAAHPAEAQLKASEARFRLLAENSTDLISRHSPDGLFLYASPSSRALLGYAPEELVGRSPFDWVHPDDVPRVRNSLTTILNQPATDIVEYRFLHQDGSYAWLETSGRRVCDAAGNFAEIQAATRAIGRRKAAELALTASEERLRSLITSMPVIVAAIDRNGVFTFSDGKGLAGLGLKPGEVIGKSVFEYYREVPAIIQAVRRALAGESMTEKVRVGGLMFDAWYSPWLEADGRVAGVTVVAIDVTDRDLLEEQLRQAQKMEAIGQLAGGIAHDFNNILTVIQGHLGLLISDSLATADMRESFHELKTVADRATHLTRQLLAFSRRQLMQVQPLDLKQLLLNLANMLQRLIGEHIVLEFQDCPQALRVEADAGMIEQAIVNLAVNARDAMPGGGRLVISTALVELDSIQAGRNPEARPGRFARLSISDNGCGMAPATMKRIFEPFFTTKEKGKGAGLGLATVYGIVKQHRGWIQVSSTAGVGSAFEVYLPASPAAAEIEPALTGNQDFQGGEETLLVVEDEPSLRHLLVKWLGRYGYRIFAARSGVEALELWTQHREAIQLVLTDMVMPEGITGKELADRLLADKPTLKVIYSSGYSTEMLATALPLVEGENYLPKPYDPLVLARIVRKKLDEP